MSGGLPWRIEHACFNSGAEAACLQDQADNAPALALFRARTSRRPTSPPAEAHPFTYAAALRPAMRPNTAPAISPVPLA